LSAYPARSPHDDPAKPALAAFATAVKRGADPAAIVRGAENFAAHAKQHISDPRFIPQAAKWLRDERWRQHQTPPAAVKPRPYVPGRR
jgi:hypothetical protein